MPRRLTERAEKLVEKMSGTSLFGCATQNEPCKSADKQTIALLSNRSQILRELNSLELTGPVAPGRFLGFRLRRRPRIGHKLQSSPLAPASDEHRLIDNDQTIITILVMTINLNAAFV